MVVSEEKYKRHPDITSHTPYSGDKLIVEHNHITKKDDHHCMPIKGSTGTQCLHALAEAVFPFHLLGTLYVPGNTAASRTSRGMIILRPVSFLLMTITISIWAT